MTTTKLLTAGAALLLGATALAQNCTFNVFPIRFVDAQGVLRPLGPDGAAGYPDEIVHLAFDPTTPSGIYYVHVTDADITEVLSANDPMDRFVQVANTGGVITLQLPFSANPDPTLFGLGLGGVGQSLRLGALDGSAANPCVFKVWFGDTWDLQFGPEWPFLVRGGSVNPTTSQCQIASFALFRIGDGTGSDVTGSVFLDADRDGVRDPGEGPAVGWQVQLVTGGTTQLTSTDANGDYRFVDVSAASYTVELVLQSGFVATTTSTATVAVLGCADAPIGAFGVAPSQMACDGHTIGFWRNKHGLELVTQHGVLATLPALHLRNQAGQLVAPATNNAWKAWLQGANSVNMAYMLSAQLAAMHCNVLAGFVDAGCTISDPVLGDITIANLMAQAVASLGQHGLTTVGHPQREAQQRLKNALDAANNNQNWL